MTVPGLPRLALSVRQPWAWAIIFGGKDIENRSWQAVNHGLRQRGRVAIHAAKGMTRDEYESASDFMAGLGVTCPAPDDLIRGAVIGSVEVIDLVSDSESGWFMGPRGLVLRDPLPCYPIPAARLLAILALATVASLALFASAGPPKLRGTIDAHGNPAFSAPSRLISKGE